MMTTALHYTFEIVIGNAYTSLHPSRYFSAVSCHTRARGSHGQRTANHARNRPSRSSSTVVVALHNAASTRTCCVGALTRIDNEPQTRVVKQRRFQVPLSNV